jgi:hypothetical protein
MTAPAAKSFADLVNVAGRPVAQGTFEHGWRWSNNVKPIVDTESCRAVDFGPGHPCQVLPISRSNFRSILARSACRDRAQ